MPMRVDRIIEDFLDYRAYVSHTLCQHRLFLGLSSPMSSREWLSDAAVWPLVHDEAVRLCSLAGTLYGIVIVPFGPLDKVFIEINQTAHTMSRVQGELVGKGDAASFEQFRELSRHLMDVLREIYAVLDRDTPEFSAEAVLKALESRDRMQWQEQVNEHTKTRLAPLVVMLVSGQEDCAASEVYRQFWAASAQAYLLTRKAVVAAAAEDASPAALGPIRAAQRLLRGTESVVSCWAPSVAEQDRPEQIEKSIRAQGFESPAGLVARLEKGIHCE